MPAAEFDDLPLDAVAGVLALAHTPSVTQTRSPLLIYWTGRANLNREHRSHLAIESKRTSMTVRYDTPNVAARAVNELFRLLAEAGISVAGTRALRVRGRKTGKIHGVVVNLLTVDDRDYVVSPRGNTQWTRNARAAGSVQTGPRWRSREVRVAEVSDDDKPDLLKRYLDR